MRAYELYETDPLDLDSQLIIEPRRHGRREPVLSLRHIHKLKRMKAAREAEYAAKLALWQAMYGSDDAARRELDQRDADLDRREEELRLRKLKADLQVAAAKVKVGAERQDHLEKMAMNDVRRRKRSPQE